MRLVFHVTSVLNRDSITDYGLDWTLMADAPGPVDVWAIEGVEEEQLITPPNGFQYVARRIAPPMLSLDRRDVAGGHV